MSRVQQQKPTRTCDKTYVKYQNFRPYLKADFNQRCGYCDDPGSHYGQEISYHIDHFKPKSKFPNLETNYNNLVYSCPYCNGAKSDKWRETDGFIDPCDSKYDIHLSRNNKGQIKAKTPRGKYIVNNLKLFLKRHEVIWILATLDRQKQQLKNNIDNGTTSEILSEFYKIQCQIDKYTASL